MRRWIVAALAAVLAVVAVVPAAAQSPAPVLVYITWDGLPGQQLDRLLAEGQVPNVQRLIDRGTHIPRTVGNWTSSTPQSHAAIWTGAYGSVNGISASMPQQPASAFPVTSFGPSPFSADNLLVEPIWVTAARSDRTTTAVSVTHATPFAMYTTDDYVSPQGDARAFGDFSDRLLLSDPYRTTALPPTTYLASTDSSAAVVLVETDTAGWDNVPAWPDAVFRAFTIGGSGGSGGSGGDQDVTLAGLVVAPDGEVFTEVVLSADRDYETGVTLRASPSANDASQMSQPVRFTDCAPPSCVTGYAHLRLTELAADGSSLTLWRTYLRDHGAYTTEPSRIAEWIANGGAFTGNGATLPPIDELPALPNVYGEIAFQVNEYLFENLVYEIERDSADLYFGYSPYPDEWNDQLYAYTQDTPVTTPQRRATATSYVDEMLRNLDGHLGDVMDALDAGGRDWNIVLTTDHGMEPAYRTFYAARALREAGLTVADATGVVDPTASQVFYAGNGVIRINLAGRYAGGIVGDQDYRAVVAATRAALLGVRGTDGQPVVAEVVEAADFTAEGLGGPHGGELHLDLVDDSGYFWGNGLGPVDAPVVEDTVAGRAGWQGGRTATNESLQGFAVLGGDQFADGVEIPQARSTDLTPTAAAAVGIAPAVHWTGQVLEAALADAADTVVKRVAAQATDPVGAAIALCQERFGADGSADRALLTRDDVFADALTGAPLAGDDACVLMTAGGPGATLDPRTRAELDRVLVDGASVEVLGGEKAVAPAVADELTAAGYGVRRLAGADRYGTAAVIAEAFQAEHPDNHRALVAYAWDWPDAVTAGAYGADAGIPILLTGTRRLEPVTAAALTDLGITATTVVGGEAVVSDDVLADLPGGARVAGPNRMATAAAVASELWAEQPGTVAVVNLERPDGWAWALAAAPLSAHRAAPQLGVGTDRYPSETAAYVETLIGAEAYVVGSTEVVSDAVVEQIEQALAE